MDHLQVFRSVFYKHVPDARKRKLDGKSEPMIIVGYHKIEAYRLFNLNNKKLMVIRDVFVNEDSS